MAESRWQTSGEIAGEYCLQEDNMDNWWLVFFWSGPLGIGGFLVLLGTFIWLLAKADEVRKRIPK